MYHQHHGIKVVNFVPTFMTVKNKTRLGTGKSRKKTSSKYVLVVVHDQEGRDHEMPKIKQNRINMNTL